MTQHGCPEDWREQVARVAAKQARRRVQRQAFEHYEERRIEAAVPQLRRPDIPFHSEIEPKWHREHRARNRHERRVMGYAEAVGNTAAVSTEEMMRRNKKAEHARKGRLRWRYLKPLAPAPGADSPLRPVTKESVITSRMALHGAAGCRSAMATLPVPQQERLMGYAEELERGYLRSRYADAFHSPQMQKVVATLCAILRNARVSWRDGFDYVTVGISREGICRIMGHTKRGARYTVFSLSHVSSGSLAVLERLGILERVQLPSERAAKCDIGHRTGRAFNHYLFRRDMVPQGDQWHRSCFDPNPSAPRDLIEAVCPWLALTQGEHRRIRLEARDAMKRAIDNAADRAEDPALDHVDTLALGEPLHRAFREARPPPSGDPPA